ncbi:MAG: prolipoprotein diacylglyceryl transferase [Nocardioides sp.]|nr:prolipoprotein diacylglyceryl transferase [Nocardioides sp.]
MISAISAALPLSIPSPANGVWHLGPVPIRGYALMIILGIIVAVWVSERRWVARGGRPGEIQDIAIWAVPFGLVGGRIYHVITDHDLYFGGPDTKWYHAFFIWQGGLGVWGAIALGAVGAIIGARRRHIRVWPLLDTLAPSCLLAQGIGRWGNWFNQELFGRPTDLPWALKIDAAKWPAPYDPDGRLPSTVSADHTYALFHPTFLYEFVWDIVLFFVIVYLAKRLRLGGGRVLALYVMAYCLGRGLIETLRIDNVELQNVLGLRWSEWMSILLFLIAAAWWAYVTFTGRGRLEESVYDDGFAPAADGDDEKTDAKAEQSAEKPEDDVRDEPAAEEQAEQPAESPEESSAKP